MYDRALGSSRAPIARYGLMCACEPTASMQFLLCGLRAPFNSRLCSACEDIVYVTSCVNLAALPLLL